MPAFENQTETLFLIWKFVWFHFSLWTSRIRVTIVTNHSGPCQTATRVSEVFHVIFDKQFACNCCCRLKLSFKRKIFGLWNLSLSIGRRSDNSMLIGCLHNFTHLPLFCIFTTFCRNSRNSRVSTRVTTAIENGKITI